VQVQVQSELATADHWIIDGDLGPYDVLAPRLSQADTVMVLDFGLLHCLRRAGRRSRQHADFLWWVITWRRRSRPIVLQAVAVHGRGAEVRLVRTPGQLRRLPATSRRRRAVSTARDIPHSVGAGQTRDHARTSAPARAGRSAPSGRPAAAGLGTGVHLAAQRARRGGVPTPVPDLRSDQEQAITATCTSTLMNATVSDQTGAPVGFVAFTADQASQLGVIEMLAVDPNRQRAEIGTALTTFALRALRDAGRHTAMVETGGDPGHAAARRIYEKAGCTLLPIAATSSHWTTSSRPIPSVSRRDHQHRSLRLRRQTEPPSEPTGAPPAPLTMAERNLWLRLPFRPDPREDEDGTSVRTIARLLSLMLSALFTGVSFGTRPCLGPR